MFTAQAVNSALTDEIFAPLAAIGDAARNRLGRNPAPEDLPFAAMMMPIGLFVIPRVEWIVLVRPPKQHIMVLMHLAPQLQR